MVPAPKQGEADLVDSLTDSGDYCPTPRTEQEDRSDGQSTTSTRTGKSLWIGMISGEGSNRLAEERHFPPTGTLQPRPIEKHQGTGHHEGERDPVPASRPGL